LTGTISLKNVGALTWNDTFRLAPTPRDQPSNIAADSWLSDIRVAHSDTHALPDEVGTFTFEVQGNELGLHAQTFGLVAEGIAWFSDQGGPTDDYLQLVVDVRECEAPWEEIRQVVELAPQLEISDNAGHGNDGDGQAKANASDGEIPPAVLYGCNASNSQLALDALAWALVGLIALGARRRRRSLSR
jgi:MYXO-CTERM domain-containing protein